MPFIYTVALATPGNLTTNGSANTETETFFVKAGSGRNVGVQKVDVQGKGAGLTAISGIAFRLNKWSTASTAGTSVTPAPRDPGMQAAKATAATRPTSGSTRTIDAGRLGHSLAEFRVFRDHRGIVTSGNR